MSLVGASASGSSLVLEEREGQERRYLYQPEGSREVQTLSVEACQKLGACDAAGEPYLGNLRLQPASDFALFDAPLPLSQPVSWLGLDGKLTLRPEKTRFGGEDWSLALERDGHDPEVAWTYPGQLAATRARGYLAADALWVQLSREGGTGLRCAVQRASVRELVGAALDSDALEQLHAGKLEEAEGTLRRAVEANPGDATALYNLACALARQHKGDEAVEKLQRAFALDPQKLKMTAREDSDLESLKARADFQAMVAPKGLDATP